MEYKLIFPDLKLCFRITLQNWAHIAALRLLKWDPDKVFAIKNDDFSFPIGFRVPNIFKRLLFANSSKAEIKSQMTFRNLDSKIKSEFKSYILGGNS